MLDELVEIARERYPAIIEDLELQQNLLTDRDILFNLELYNLVSRQEIIEYMNDVEKSEIEFVECKEFIEPDDIRDNLFRLTNKGYYVMSSNLTSLTIVKDIGNTQMVSGAYLGAYNLVEKYITPLNFVILTEGEYTIQSYMDGKIFLKRVIYDAIAQHASDIHFVNSKNRHGGYDYAVYYRLLNNYKIQADIKVDKSFIDRAIVDMVSTVTLEDPANLDLSHGVVTSWLNPLYDGKVDLRVTCSSTKGGYTCVIRIAQIALVGKGIKELGFDEDTQEVLYNLADRENGFTVIAGAMRTGKNTTMVGMINEIIKKPLKIMEFSSPIETIMPFEQYDYYGSKATLSNYINLIKKQDCDIAMLNEIPDKGTANELLDLVNSSVGVLTTFHIGRIWELPWKLVDYFGENYRNIITLMNGIVTQKMFVKICPHCRVEVMSDKHPKFVKDLMEKHGIEKYYISEGCPKCNGTGRENAVQPLAEYLIFSSDFKRKLLRCENIWDMQELIKDEVEANHDTLEYKIADRIRQGMLSPVDFKKLE